MAEHSVDLAAYLSRIGYTGPVAPTLDVLRAIQMRHVCSIPFENLDVLLGRGIALDLDSVQAKLVTNRRGGYCFEQNWLMLHVLRQIGFEAMPLSARVRLDRPRDRVPPRTHGFGKVILNAEQAGSAVNAGDWLVDVGVGSMSPTAPFRMVENAEQSTPHETRRLVREPGAARPIACSHTIHNMVMKAAVGATQAAFDDVVHPSQQAKKGGRLEHNVWHIEAGAIASGILFPKSSAVV